jgi:hypothetical protein
MKCEYCKKEFSSTSSHNRHLREAKKCLAIRQEIRLEKNCTFCHKELSNKQNLTVHMKKCKHKNTPTLSSTVSQLQKEVETLKETINKLYNSELIPNPKPRIKFTPLFA